MDIKTDKKQLKQTKKVDTPRTEVSLAQAQTAKHFYLITSLILAAIIIGGGYASYRLFTNYIHKSNEIKAQDKLVSSLDQKIKDLDALKAPYAEIADTKGGAGSDADIILRALPTDQDFKGLIAMLENIANVSGVTMSSVTRTASDGTSSASSSSSTSSSSSSSSSGSSSSTTSATSSDTSASSSQPQPFIFTVSLEGPYDKIIRFLDNTEKSARVINFKSMKISGSGNAVKAELTMQTYYQDKANIDSTYEELK